MNTRYLVIAGTLASLLFSSTQINAADNALKTTLTAVSDYRFRGMSQSFREPAIQLGTEYQHNNGMYIGAWTSTISDAQYPDANWEIDLYGGYRWAINDSLNADIGALYYAYPEGNYDEFSPPVADEKFDTLELYGSLAYGNFSSKLSYSASDYFGINSKTASSYGKGDSAGTVYLSLDYTLPLNEQFSLVAHAGHSWIRNYSTLNYHDYKLGITTAVAGFTVELSGVATAALGSAGESFNSYTDDDDNSRRVYRPAVVLSVAKAF